MKKIVVPVIISFTLLMIQSVASAQTIKEEDTTKISSSKKAEIKKANTYQTTDTTKQTKITVNDDGVTNKRKVKNKIKGAKNEEKELPENKVEHKTIEPKKEE